VEVTCLAEYILEKGKLIFLLPYFFQRSTSQFMQNGQQKDVPFADGLKIGNITKLSSVTGVVIIVHVMMKKFHL